MIVVLLAIASAALTVGLRLSVAPSDSSARLPLTLDLLGRLPVSRWALVPLRRIRSLSDTTARLAAAGVVDVGAPGRVERARVWVATALVLLAALAGGPLVAIVAVAPAVALAVGAVELALGRRARRRRTAIITALPDVLDLLAVSIASGVALDAALRHAAAGSGPLAEEVARMRSDVELGEPVSAAREALAARCGCAEVDQLVATLARADELGAPPAELLGELASSMRAARRDAAREAAARAAPKIQLVVALVMVPGAVVLVLGVLVLELVRQIGGVLG